MAAFSKLQLKLPWQIPLLLLKAGVNENPSNYPAVVNGTEGRVSIHKNEALIDIIIETVEASLLRNFEDGWLCDVSSVNLEDKANTSNESDVVTQQTKVEGATDIAEDVEKILPDCSQPEERTTQESNKTSDLPKAVQTPQRRSKRSRVRSKVNVNPDDEEADDSGSPGEESKTPCMCPLCLHSFSLVNNLRRHLLKYHQVEWSVYLKASENHTGVLNIREKIIILQNIDKSKCSFPDVEVCKICSQPLGSAGRARSIHLRRKHGVTMEEYDKMSDMSPQEMDVFLRKRSEVKSSKENPGEYCQQCQKPFTSLSTYAAHVRAMHPKDDELKLDLEKKRSASNTSSIVMSCPLCPEVRNGKAIFRHFKDIHSKDSNYTSLLNNLRESHKAKFLASERNRYRKLVNLSAKCKFCHQEFEHRWARTRHQRKCSQNPNPPKLYHCTRCARIYFSESRFEKHKLMHTEADEYSCEFCGKRYRNKSGLYVHLRKAHDIQMKAPNYKHVCNICEKRFFDRSRLNDHMLRHADKRNHMCDHCGKSFKTSNDLQKHIKTIHQKKYRFYCNLCGHGVNKMSYLQSHRCGHVRRNQNENTPVDTSVPSVITDSAPPMEKFDTLEAASKADEFSNPSFLFTTAESNHLSSMDQHAFEVKRNETALDFPTMDQHLITMENPPADLLAYSSQATAGLPQNVLTSSFQLLNPQDTMPSGNPLVNEASQLYQ